MEHQECTRGGAPCTGFWGVPRHPLVAGCRYENHALLSQAKVLTYVNITLLNISQLTYLDDNGTVYMRRAFHVNYVKKFSANKILCFGKVRKQSFTASRGDESR